MLDFDRNYAAILDLVKPQADAHFPAVKSKELEELHAYAEVNPPRVGSLMLLPAFAAQLGGHEQVLAQAAAEAASIRPGAMYVSAEQRKAVFDRMNQLRELVRRGEFTFFYQCEGDPDEAVIKWTNNKT